MKNWIKLICLNFLLILTSCSHNKKNSDIQINKSKDTISVDEIFEADLYIENYSDRLPEFFIISKNDTNRIPFEDLIKSAVFKAKSHVIGKNIFKGYAQYYDSLGILKRENFEISFVVK